LDRENREKDARPLDNEKAISATVYLQGGYRKGVLVLANLRVLSSVSLLLGVALAVSVARAATVPSPLDAFKKLQGTWAIQSDGKTLSIQMTYRTASKDSVVVEQFGRELSVFAMDGTALTMTHYCNVGNQPRLRLKQPTAPNIYEFDLYEVVSPEGAPTDHVEKMIYEFLSEERIDLRIMWWHPSGGQVEHYLLERSQPAG
jgi:hypothetical protein